jgi:hypothetical protein
MALNIASLDETTAQGKQYLAAIKTAAINQLGYFYCQVNYSMCLARKASKVSLLSKH